MSLKYRNSQGVETPVAGLNGQNGSLVPSVSLYQSGTVTFSCEANAWNTVDVTFNTPMPDDDYQVILDSARTAYVHVQNVTYKTTTGFTMIVYNRDTLTSGQGIINWQAFKLMTDTVHEADSAHIAQNTANFAPAFSETTSYAVGDYCTYNNVLYRCTTAHTAGTWVAGHFTQVTVGENLSSLDTLKTDFASFGKIDTASGYLTDDQLKTINYNVCKTVGYAGSAEIPDSATILVGFMNFTQGTDQQYQLLFQFNTGKVWTRSRYGTWTSWQKLATTDGTLNPISNLSDANIATSDSSIKYAVSSDTTANLPTDISVLYGLLEVSQNSSGNALVQTLTAIYYGTNNEALTASYHRSAYFNGNNWMWSAWERFAVKSDLPTSGVGSGINMQDIVSGDADTTINIPAFHFCSGLMYLQMSGIGTALLSYEIDYVRNLTLKVIAGTGISLTGLTLNKGETLLGTFSANGDYITFTAQYSTVIRTDYASL